jgi:hypothetical protein
LDSVSTLSSDLASPSEGVLVQDRWAQIRKNAAERAKVVPKASDEYTSDARGSIDDGETSGEESKLSSTSPLLPFSASSD